MQRTWLPMQACRRRRISRERRSCRIRPTGPATRNRRTPYGSRLLHRSDSTSVPGNSMSENATKAKDTTPQSSRSHADASTSSSPRCAAESSTETSPQPKRPQRPSSYKPRSRLCVSDDRNVAQSALQHARQQHPQREAETLHTPSNPTHGVDNLYRNTPRRWCIDLLTITSKWSFAKEDASRYSRYRIFTEF